MTRARLATAAVALSLMFAACVQAPVTKSPVGVTLMDVTASDTGGAIQARYLEDLGRLIDWVAQRSGILYGDVIGANALGEDTTPLNVDYSLSVGVPANRLYEDADRARKKAVALEVAKSILSAGLRRPAQTTDIVSAILAAGRLLAAHPGTIERVLLIESDMVEDAPGVGNFYSDDLSTGGITTKIEALRRNGLIPDLRGVVVLVAGAGIDVAGGLPQERTLQIERFWRVYFNAAGASIPPGGYGSRLIALPS